MFTGRRSLQLQARRSCKSPPGNCDGTRRGVTGGLLRYLCSSSSLKELKSTWLVPPLSVCVVRAVHWKSGQSPAVKHVFFAIRQFDRECLEKGGNESV